MTIAPDPQGRPVVIGASGRPYRLAANALDDVDDWIAAIDRWCALIAQHHPGHRADLDALLDARTELTVEDTP